jgi:MFS family permease
MTNPFEGLTAEQRRKNLFVLAAANFLRGAHMTIYNVIWQPFALSLGASMPMVGLLNSLGGMNGIFTTIAQAIGGWLADRLGCKPFILASFFFILAAYGIFVIADLSTVWGWMLLGIVLMGLSWLSRPAVSSMVAESASRDRQGSMFSLMMFAWIVPGIIAPTAGGWLTEQWSFAGVFTLLAAFEASALFLTWRYLKEGRLSRDPVSLSEAGKAFLRSILPQKGLEWFFIAVAADAFVWGLGWGLINGLLKDAQKFTVSQLGIMASVMALTWAAVQLPVGRYLDGHAAKRLLIVSEILGIPIMAITMIRPTFPVMAALQIPFALVAATWVPTISTFIARAVAVSERSESFGRLNMFRGLFAFPSSWVGGLIYARWGFKAPLAVTLAGIFIILAILVFCVREPEANPSGPDPAV